MLTKIKQTTYTEIVQKCLEEKELGRLGAMRKSDGSLVTNIDIKISQELKALLLNNDKKSGFFSEEEEGDLSFPSYILDPIDGTWGFVKGNKEWVVSLAYMSSESIDDEKNCGLLFNPQINLWLESWSGKAYERQKDSHLIGAVSRNDFGQNDLVDHGKPTIRLERKGSIALKLGLLSSNHYDFVFSKTNKNIWDIAAGTIICHRRGLSLYNKHGKMKTLENEQVLGPLLWCHDNDYERLSYLMEMK